MSIEINRENYEAYLIDYLEGNLNEREQETVKIFLTQNPDIAEEFAGISNVTLKKNDTELTDKKKLKKNLYDIVPAAFADMDEFMAAALENDLDDNGKSALEYLLANDKGLARDYKYFEQTRLQADSNVVFKNKNLLKKKSGILLSMPAVLRYGVAVAAAILLFLTLVLNKIDLNNNGALLSEKALNPYQKQASSTHANITGFAPAKYFGSAYAEAVSSAFRKNYLIINKPEPITIRRQISDAGSRIINVDTVTQYREFVINAKKEENPKVIQLKQLSNSMNNIRIEYDNQAEPVVSGNVKTLNEFVASKIKKTVLQDENENRKVTFWDYAGAGIKGFSKLFGKSYDLNTQYSNDGKVTQLAFSSPKVQFVIPVNKKEK